LRPGLTRVEKGDRIRVIEERKAIRALLAADNALIAAMSPGEARDVVRNRHAVNAAKSAALSRELAAFQAVIDLGREAPGTGLRPPPGPSTRVREIDSALRRLAHAARAWAYGSAPDDVVEDELQDAVDAVERLVPLRFWEQEP